MGIQSSLNQLFLTSLGTAAALKSSPVAKEKKEIKEAEEAAAFQEAKAAAFREGKGDADWSPEEQLVVSRQNLEAYKARRAATKRKETAGARTDFARSLQEERRIQTESELIDRLQREIERKREAEEAERRRRESIREAILNPGRDNV